MKLDDIKGSLGDTLQRYWKPALAGAALGGTTAGYLSRNAGEPGETPGTRRKRMLRNALAGVLLGGTAGLAIPAGARIAASPWSGKKPSGLLHPIDKSIDFTGANIAPAVVAGAGGAMIHKSLRTNQEEGLGRLFQNFKGNKSDLKWPGLETPEAFRAAIHGQPGAADMVKKVLAQGMEAKGPVSHAALRAKEQMAEAGLKEKGDLTRMFKNLMHPRSAEPGFMEGARALASEGGPVGKGLASIPGEAGGVASELYRRAVRPTISGRFSLPAKLLGLGGAAYLAKKLQNKVLGE